MFNQFIHRQSKNSHSKNIDDRTLIIAILIFSIVGSLIVMNLKTGSFLTIRPIIIGLTIIEIIVLVMAVLGNLIPAKTIMPIAAYIVFTLLIFYGGIHDDAIGGYYFLLIFATLLLGRKGLLIFGFLNTAAIIIIGIAETGGIIATRFGPLTDPSTVITTAFFMIAAALTLYFFITRLAQMVEISRENEQKMVEINRVLEELQTVLEQHVADRTAALQSTNKKLKTKLKVIKKLQAELHEEAIRDFLTGLFNRRFLNENLNLEISRAKRLNFPITIFFLDIDNFKLFNDQYGHQAGDIILKIIGKVIQNGLRAGDIACRYGGEEFLVVLPGMPKEKAKTCAERVRGQINDLVIPISHYQIQVTVSIGVAVFPQDADSMQALIHSADKALYSAKDKGRNRVELVN